jgi:hypothetical protein
MPNSLSGPESARFERKRGQAGLLRGSLFSQRENDLARREIAVALNPSDSFAETTKPRAVMPLGASVNQFTLVFA